MWQAGLHYTLGDLTLVLPLTGSRTLMTCSDSPGPWSSSCGCSVSKEEVQEAKMLWDEGTPSPKLPQISSMERETAGYQAHSLSVGATMAFSPL